MAKEDFSTYDQKEETYYQSKFGEDPRAYDKFNEMMAEIDEERDDESLSHMPTNNGWLQGVVFRRKE